MGTILLLKEADFSQNAVPAENVYDVVKETDFETATPHYPMTNTMSYYNTIPLAKKIKVYGVRVVLQETAANVDLEAASVVSVGATDGQTILRRVNTDISDIAADFKAGIIEPGSEHTIMLSSPIIINAGEYIALGHGGGNRLICYSRNNNSGHGFMATIGGGEPTPPETNWSNLAAIFYGVELD